MSRLLINNFCIKKCLSVNNLLTSRIGVGTQAGNKYCQFRLAQERVSHIIAQTVSGFAVSGSLLCYNRSAYNQHIQFSTGQPTDNNQEHESNSLTESEFEDLCHETLESLAERFEELIDESYTTKEYDVSLSSGVLTVKLGTNKGTYVINKQTPNRQIWLSSPFSGPKRYDYINGCWIYKHDGRTLHQILSEEISEAFNTSIEFTSCANSGAT